MPDALFVWFGELSGTPNFHAGVKGEKGDAREGEHTQTLEGLQAPRCRSCDCGGGEVRGHENVANNIRRAVTRELLVFYPSNSNDQVRGRGMDRIRIGMN